MKVYHEQVLLCVESCSKVVRTETALKVICEMRNAGSSNEQVNDAFAHSTVISSYNKMNYRLESVDFGMSPTSTFQKKDGTVTTFMDYYKTRYGLDIQEI